MKDARFTPGQARAIAAFGAAFALGFVALALLKARGKGPYEAGARACRSRLDERILAESEALGERRPARSATFDVVFPADESQARRLNSMAIVQVVAFSETSEDLPLRRALVLRESQPKVVFELPETRFAGAPGVEEMAENSPWRRSGRFRQRLFAFLPLQFAKEPGELYAVFREDRAELRLARLPAPPSLLPSFLLTTPPLPPDPTGKVDGDLARGLIRAAFCL